VIKIVLAVMCYRISTPTMKALAADHRNDVVATLVALVFGIIGKFLSSSIHRTYELLPDEYDDLGSKAIDGEIKPRELSVIDPVGKRMLQRVEHVFVYIVFLFYGFFFLSSCSGAIVISLYIIICWIPQVRRK
jgi:hypothetical protein